jgi:hypothetical protein
VFGSGAWLGSSDAAHTISGGFPTVSPVEGGSDAVLVMVHLRLAQDNSLIASSFT